MRRTCNRNNVHRPTMELPPPMTDTECEKEFKKVIAGSRSKMGLEHFMTLSPDARIEVLEILRELKANYALVDRVERQMEEEKRLHDHSS
jgi:hypothetical protein